MKLTDVKKFKYFTRNINNLVFLRLDKRLLDIRRTLSKQYLSNNLELIFNNLILSNIFVIHKKNIDFQEARWISGSVWDFKTSKMISHFTLSRSISLSPPEEIGYPSALLYVHMSSFHTSRASPPLTSPSLTPPFCPFKPGRKAKSVKTWIENLPDDSFPCQNRQIYKKFWWT